MGRVKWKIELVMVRKKWRLRFEKKPAEESLYTLGMPPRLGGSHSLKPPRV